ncbi:t1pks [Neopestalotiopsis sp. 37M]|nr:t1pks [Neopestalotiopsis sp. 37M]
MANLNGTPTLSTNGSNGMAHLKGLNDGATNSTQAVDNTANGDSKEKPFTPIAICGMACRLPGKIASPKEMWDFIAAGKDARTEVPATRWSSKAWHSATKKKGTSRTKHGYFLDESVDLGALDASAFPMPRSEIERMDPQQRLLLEVTHECLDDSGEVDWKGSSTGVYVGCFGQDWYDVQTRDMLKYSNYQITGSHDFMVSERISHELDLHGPCPDGSSKTFSANANGFARGEGIVAIYVKKLDDAIRDGNAIRAVISGIATNFDGKTATMGRPFAPTQEANIRRAYEVAGITDVWRTGLFECHGTGTAAGDPVETAALAAVFGEKGIYISSIKPNLGHSEGAAGVSGVLKAVLALQNSTIPPNIKAWPLSPAIPFEKAKLTVASKCVPWPAGRHKRVSINSFGIAGANGHAIIDSADSYGVLSDDREEGAGKPSLFLYSAHSPKSLEMMTQNLQNFLETSSDSFANIAYTLGRKRRHLPYRSFMVATKSRPSNAAPSFMPDPDSTHSLVMIFTGQGAQWPQMGKDLIRDNTVFAATIKTIDNELQRLGAEWTIEDELRKNSRSTRVHEAEFSQPLCSAIQLALVDTLASVGVRPTAVVGHSSGEIAAAYAAGALTLSEATAIAYHRGKTSRLQTKRGAMAAVGMSWEEVQKYLITGVVVACDNAHNSVTLSGDADEVALVVKKIKEARPETLTTILKVERAYHSHHMVEIGQDYHQALVASGVVGAPHSVPFFSSVSGKLLDTKSQGGQLGSRYWQHNLESPVQFKSAVVELLKHPEIVNPVFLEVGPHSALEGPVRQILVHESRKAPQLPTLTRRQNGTESLLIAIGKLWALHFNVDLTSLLPSGRTLNDLPCYPWDHQKSHWYESRVSREWRLGGHAYHDLLGRRLPESTALEPIWRNLLHLENVPWVYDHRIQNDIVFPAAGFIAIAVEAIRQISEAVQTVDLRNVVVSNALPISEESPTELVTALRRSRLTDSLDSEWWDFSITSYNGNIWTRHCTGQVRSGSLDLTSITPVRFASSSLPRKVDSRKWYEAVHRKQLSYGPHFTSMESITASVTTPSKAAATLKNNWHGDEANYFLHPVIIDAFFQLLSTAVYDGQPHQYRRLVPTGVDYMTISPCRADSLQLGTGVDLAANGTASGYAQCIAESKVVADCSGLRLILFEGVDATAQNDFPLTSRSEWVPHAGLGELSNVWESKSPELDGGEAQTFHDLVHFAIQYSQEVARNIEPQAPHLQAYKRWLDEQAITPAGQGQVSETIDSLQSTALRLGAGHLATEAEAVAKVCAAIGTILAGTRNAYDVLATDGLLERANRSLVEYDGSTLFHNLGLFKPNLRILELGAGTGVATVKVLQSLRHPKGQNLFSRYVMTDSSTGLLDRAKTRFKGSKDLEYACLDIERDLASQDFEQEEFDLIIAAGVLSSTKKIAQSISNIQKLLSPKGRVLVQEPRPGSSWAKFVLGILPSWWAGQDDERATEPFISQERLENELRNAGLSRCQIINDDRSTIMVAQAISEESISQKVTVLCEKMTSETEVVCAQLEARGYDITRAALENASIVTTNAPIIALLDLAEPFAWDLNEARYKAFQRFVTNVQDSGVLWVTRQSQAGVKDPRYAPILGLARTMRTELAVNFATCEVDNLEKEANLHALIDVFCDFQDRRYDGPLGPEYEYAVSDGKVLVNRFFPFDLETEIRESMPGPEATLKITKVGQPGTLHWSAQPRITPQGDEVEVQIHATGLNFRDVLVATGVLQLPETQFGYEAAGIVTKLGPKATKFSIGDRVMLIGRGTFASSVVQSQLLCEKAPDTLDMLQAAASPLVFLTAIHGLLDMARLEDNQSVLIHSAAGGVGIAAILVAKMRRATIYATVSSQEKRQFLIDSLGIQNENIFDSRSTSFATEIMSKTGGKGVDVALNSLSGELLHATWSCVAKWGTMVEIGKRDLLGSAKLDMKPFSDNRTYCSVDIDQMAKERPRVIERLLRRLASHFQQRQLQPIPLAQSFNPSEAANAIKFMQRSQHIGKIVMNLRDSIGNVLFEQVDLPHKRLFEFDGSAAYLLVGGLGGLGRSVARYMVQQGARKLVFFSRTSSKDHPRHEAYIKEIEAMGAVVQCVQGDVSDTAAVQRAFDVAQGPVKGILNLTIALADNAFERMTIDEWSVSVNPKIKGSWNILELVKSLGLQVDFFILISSLSGIVGLTGQANYSSANTFIDAFSQYSTNHGLPCTSITSGVMEDIGVMSNNTEILRRLVGSGWRLNNESELLETVDSAIQLCSQRTHVTHTSDSPMTLDKTRFIFGLCPTVPLHRPDSYTNLRADCRMAVFHNSKRQSNKSGASEGASLRTLLSAAKRDPSTLESDESITLLALEIGKKLCNLLLLPEDQLSPSMRTAEMGLDSMVAVEMGAWWKVTFGIEMSTLEVVNIGTLQGLGKRAADDLIRLHSDPAKGYKNAA